MGTRVVDEIEGLPSRTDFTVIERCADGTTLLEAKLGTGRTNQIRVHLWQLGFPSRAIPPICQTGRRATRRRSIPASPPLQLHAWKLSFRHPLSGEEMDFETARPDWSC